MKFSDFLDRLYAECNVVLDCNPEVKSNIYGAYYIPLSREGKREFVLVFENDVPDSNTEWDLYRLAYGMNNSNPEEIKLNMAHDLIFILTTLKEDKNFRTAHPQLIKDNVQFEMFDPAYINNQNSNRYPVSSNGLLEKEAIFSH